MNQKKNLLDFLLQKKQKFKIRVTTFLQGELKNKFMDDCIKRDVQESELAGEIIKAYYSMLSEMPSMQQKEIPEIKNYIINKIKL